MEVIVCSGNKRRRAIAAGRDIYAITAQLVLEAMTRIVEGKISKKGVVFPAEVFAAADFLLALNPQHLLIELST